MTPTKRCDLCDTPLEFEHAGQLLAFSAHTDEWCRAATKELTIGLRLALKAKDEFCRGFTTYLLRQADDALRDAGAPTLTDRAQQAYEVALRRFIGMPVDGGLPS